MARFVTWIVDFLKLNLPHLFRESDRGRICHECNQVVLEGNGIMVVGQLVCSERCLHNLWISANQSYADKTGRKICSLPGCGKECYMEEGGRVHDYCSRSHSKDHVAQLRDFYGSIIEIKRCKKPDCKKFCYVDDYGQMFDYCCKDHYRSHQQMTPIADYTKGGPILFYNKFEPFYEFTNFYEFAPFEIDGKEWRSTEHYFQAQKFIGTPYEEYIRLYATTPRVAFQLARDVESLKWQRSDWEHIKVHVMYKALLAKFLAHERLRQLLLSTGERALVEHTFTDNFWGDGGTGFGHNHLGGLLKKVRELLKETKRSTSPAGK